MIGVPFCEVVAFLIASSRNATSATIGAAANMDLAICKNRILIISAVVAIDVMAFAGCVKGDFWRLGGIHLVLTFCL